MGDNPYRLVPFGWRHKGSWQISRPPSEARGRSGKVISPLRWMTSHRIDALRPTTLQNSCQEKPAGPSNPVVPRNPRSASPSAKSLGAAPLARFTLTRTDRGLSDQETPPGRATIEVTDRHLIRIKHISASQTSHRVPPREKRSRATDESETPVWEQTSERRVWRG